jgi:hypothetical protein
MVLPVPKLNRKYLPSIPAFVADFLSYYMTIFDGLFCPTPPSINE